MRNPDFSKIDFSIKESQSNLEKWKKEAEEAY